MQLPSRVAGYYIYMRLERADGKSLPPLRQGRPLVLTGPEGKAMVALMLVSRYDAKTRRLQYAALIKNLRLQDYRATNEGLSATVTVGYRP
jgi:hypothetical protein